MNKYTYVFTTFLLTNALAPIALADVPTNAQPETTVATEQAHYQEDRNIIAIIMTVDRNEMAAASLAQAKNISPKLKHYAHYLYKQHKHNLHKLEHLAHKLHLTPLASTTSTTLEKQGEQTMSHLATLNNQEFATAYLNGMAKGHQDGLNLIDTNLLKNVSNPHLKIFLTHTREMVYNHLQHALKLQANQ